MAAATPSLKWNECTASALATPSTSVFIPHAIRRGHRFRSDGSISAETLSRLGREAYARLRLVHHRDPDPRALRVQTRHGIPEVVLVPESRGTDLSAAAVAELPATVGNACRRALLPWEAPRGEYGGRLAPAADAGEGPRIKHADQIRSAPFDVYWVAADLPYVRGDDDHSEAARR
jgi:hypothetical protein